MQASQDVLTMPGSPVGTWDTDSIDAQKDFGSTKTTKKTYFVGQEKEETIAVTPAEFSLWQEVRKTLKHLRKLASLPDNWDGRGSPSVSTNLLKTATKSEEHTSELQSHSFISYAVFCLKKKNN